MPWWRPLPICTERSAACSFAARRGMRRSSFRDTFFAFKAQLAAFIEYLRTGVRPFPFDETVELMRLLIAGLRSREEGGREVVLDAEFG